MRSPVEAFDSGSNYSFGDKMEHPSFPRSAFNLGHLVNTTIDNCGQVVILDVIETLPGDDHEINIKSLIRCLPQVVPLYSRQRIYIYAFWNRYSDLWNNFNTFMTKGYDGNTVKTVPVYDKTKNLVVSQGLKVKAGSTADGFGIQQGIDATMLEGLNCFDSMQLLRIFRDYFMNKNFYIDDRVILPDDDSRFRLGDDGQLLSAVDAGVSFKFELCDDTYAGYNVDSDTGARTFSQFCHDWPQDYFTSGLPWPQRGAMANINSLTELKFKEGNKEFTLWPFFADNGSEFAIDALSDGSEKRLVQSVETIDSSGSVAVRKPFGIGLWADQSSATGYKVYGKNDGQSLGDSKGVGEYHRMYTKFSIDMQQLRELAVNQHELEIMARTDGSYAEFGLSFFNEKSKNATDFKSVYIGGCYDNIQYTEVLQTSAQYAESSGEYVPVGSPLGTYGGHGIGSANGYIGRLHCDDYGQIMILCCVMPDVYYSTGIERRLTNKYQSDFFLPERAKLGLRPTLKKEIFYSGNSSDDDDLFNYQNIFDEYRYLPNRIKGKIADPNSENFYPYTQARLINASPEFNQGFNEANNVRKDYLQAYQEVAFTAQFRIEDRCVRALPYKGIPADILN